MALGTPVTATNNSINSQVIVASAGRLTKMVVVNNNASLVRYAMLFDATALPANGTVPKLKPLQQVSAGNTTAQTSAVGASGGSVTFDLGPNGVQFDNGIVLAMSSTADFLTVITSSDCNVTSSYSPPGP